MKHNTARKPKPPAKMVTLWVPKPLHAAVTSVIQSKETDMSKWVREAMREKVARESRQPAKP